MRKITKKDIDSVEEFVKKNHTSRKDDKFRKQHEAIWKEVDRQVNMQAAHRIKSNVDDEYHNVIELGELAKASEVLSADVRRLLFPNSRSWFEAHSEIEGELTEDGESEVDPKQQKLVDGGVRALMTQQHKDFGLKARVDLSVKEALHHGSFVVEVREDFADKLLSEDKIENISAPVWQPYSMWNAYPDPSPSVIGTDMFYKGSMILVDYLPKYKLEAIAKGDGWFPSRVKKIRIKKNQNKDVETDDLELVKYYGDVEIKRRDGNMFFPNHKIILANGVLVYFKRIETPYKPILFGGYERLDTRDPYYTSPIIKLSPLQKIASHAANKFLDAVDLKNKPPLSYDSSEAQFKQEGPRYAPGEKWSVRSADSVKLAETPDPSFAFEGMKFAAAQVESGTSVNSQRAGGTADRTEKTAFQIRKESQGGEVRIVDFVDKFEDQGLRPFLYLQHEINKQKLSGYSFYNPELDAPDFNRVSKKDLPKMVHFEIVGSKGVLGEEERTEKTTMVTSFLLGNEETKALVNTIEVAKNMYQDAGNKNPELFLNLPDEESDLRVQQIQEQAQQIIEELQGQLEELVNKEKEHGISLKMKDFEVAQLNGQIEAMEEQIQSIVRKNELEKQEADLEKRLLELRFRESNDTQG